MDDHPNSSHVVDVQSRTLKIEVYDLSVPVEDARNVLAEQIWPKLQPHWRSQKIIAEKLTGGHINSMVMYHVSDDVKMDDALVVRLFGNSGDGQESRDLEVINMQIAYYAGCFPKVRAILRNGIIYEYARGRCLLPQDTEDPNIIRLLARTLANLHYIDTSHLELVNMEGKQVTFVVQDRLIQQVTKALGACPGGLTREEFSKRIGMDMDSSIDELLAEIKFAESYLDEVKLPVAHTHADFNPNNIIINKETGEVFVLDHEFSGYGLPAVFDLSYMLNQYIWAGLSTIPPADGPEPEDRTRCWVISYLQRMHEIAGQDPVDLQEEEVELWLLSLRIMTPFMLLHIGVRCLNYVATDVPLDGGALLRVSMKAYFERKPALASLKRHYLELKAKMESC